jgi:hypothetical protein
VGDGGINPPVLVVAEDQAVVRVVEHEGLVDGVDGNIAQLMRRTGKGCRLHFP